MKQTLLYDFYGDLLTDHQKKIFEAYMLDNLSLGEIAAENNISRQGVHDTIRRCNALLEGYEEKLRLVERFLTIKQKVAVIQDCDSLDTARKIASEILEIL